MKVQIFDLAGWAHYIQLAYPQVTPHTKYTCYDEPWTFLYDAGMNAPRPIEFLALQVEQQGLLLIALHYSPDYDALVVMGTSQFIPQSDLIAAKMSVPIMTGYSKNGSEWIAVPPPQEHAQ